MTGWHCSELNSLPDSTAAIEQYNKKRRGKKKKKEKGEVRVRAEATACSTINYHAGTLSARSSLSFCWNRTWFCLWLAPDYTYRDNRSDVGRKFFFIFSLFTLDCSCMQSVDCFCRLLYSVNLPDCPARGLLSSSLPSSSSRFLQPFDAVHFLLFIPHYPDPGFASFYFISFSIGMTAGSAF